MRWVCEECGDASQREGSCARDGAAYAPALDPLLGERIGSWRVSGLIGAGGFGRVYRAVQPDIGARVAVKVLARDCLDDPDAVSRFFQEARAANLIAHEGIVEVIDLGTLPDGRPYIIMEDVPGAPLSQLFQAGPQPLGALGRLVVEVLEVLQAAHDRGIVHRDLKPDNIFRTPSGRAKVLDFGLAKLADAGARSAKTGSGLLLGSPPYLSPEQASARPADGRADLYAMGVVLFEGATGQRPFRGASLYELLCQHVEAPPPAPRTLRPEMPPVYEEVILRALAKAPDDRWPSARAMASALSAALRDLPRAEQAPFAAIAPSPAAVPSPVAAATVETRREKPGPDAPLTRASASRTAATRRDRPSRPRLTSRGVLLAIVGAVAASFATGTITVVLLRRAREARAGLPALPAVSRGMPASPPDATMVTAPPSPTPPPPSPPPPPPPGRSMPRRPGPVAGPGPTGAFEVRAFARNALGLAREIAPDAMLFHVRVVGVQAGGRFDPATGSVTYQFVSPARGEKYYPPRLCQIEVRVDRRGTTSEEVEVHNCARRPTPLPTCGPAEVWASVDEQYDGKPPARVTLGFEEGEWKVLTAEDASGTTWRHLACAARAPVPAAGGASGGSPARGFDLLATVEKARKAMASRFGGTVVIGALRLDLDARGQLAAGEGSSLRVRRAGAHTKPCADVRPGPSGFTLAHEDEACDFEALAALPTCQLSQVRAIAFEQGAPPAAAMRLEYDGRAWEVSSGWFRVEVPDACGPRRPQPDDP